MLNKKVKNLLIWLICISGIVPLFSDLIYGTKSNAEEYMFGVFLIGVSSFAFALFTITILLTLLFYLFITKIFPEIITRMYEKERDITNSKTKRKVKKR